MRLKVEIYHESSLQLQRALTAVQGYWKDSKLIMQFDPDGIKIYPRIQDSAVVHFGFILQISISRILNQYNSLPTKEEEGDVVATRPFFRDYIFKVSAASQQLKFQISSCQDLLEVLRVTTNEPSAIKVIRLKKTDNRAQYHARLMFLEMQEHTNKEENQPRAKPIDTTMLTTSMLKVNIEGNRLDGSFQQIYDSDFPISSDLCSRDEQSLLVMNPFLCPLIRDYMGYSLSKHEVYCTVGGAYTSLSYLESGLATGEEEPEETKDGEPVEKKMTVGIFGKSTSNVFEKLSTDYVLITEHGEMTDTFKLSMASRDFDALNNVVAKLTIGWKPVSGMFKVRGEDYYKVQLVLGRCEHLQVSMVGRPFTELEML